MKIWTQDNDNVTKYRLRLLISKTISEELGEDCTALELASNLERFCEAVGNPSFANWKRHMFRHTFEGEIISSSLAKKLKNLGVENVIMHSTDKEDVLRAFIDGKEQCLNPEV